MSEEKQIFQLRRSIARRPSEGGSDPSWRLKRVETYLEALAGTDPRKTIHLDDLRKENDSVVLTFLALRRGEPGVAPAYEWAWRVYQENDSAGMGTVIKALASYWGNETSDPAKVAQLLLRLVDSEHLPAHLLLGSDAVQFAGQAETARAREAERWRDVSVSTDVNARGPLPDIRF